ncbi:MAG: hypothetical protein AAGA57_03665, partial [Planctomycetota bacterium]
MHQVNKETIELERIARAQAAKEQRDSSKVRPASDQSATSSSTRSGPEDAGADVSPERKREQTEALDSGSLSQRANKKKAPKKGSTSEKATKKKATKKKATKKKATKKKAVRRKPGEKTGTRGSAHNASDPTPSEQPSHDAPTSDQATGGGKLPSAKELQQLPRWAVAGYAVRCAMRVLPATCAPGVKAPFGYWPETKVADYLLAVDLAAGVSAV